MGGGVMNRLLDTLTAHDALAVDGQRARTPCHDDVDWAAVLGQGRDVEA